MELLQTLVEELGISEYQAKGGAGMIFHLIKEKLGGDFGQVADAVPGVEELSSAAPEPGGIASAFGGITAALGSKASHLGDLTELASGFKKLDLDSGMVARFIPLIIFFVRSKGGDDVSSLLEKVLK